MVEMDKFQRVVLETLEAVQRIETELGGLKTEVGSLKSEVGNLNIEVGSLKSEVGSLKELVSGVDARVGRLEVAVGHIQAETAGLLEFRSETKEALNKLAETQAIIAGIVGEHEVKIRSLNKRLAEA